MKNRNRSWKNGRINQMHAINAINQTTCIYNIVKAYF